MDKKNTPAVAAANRRKRVARLKKILIAVAVIFLVIPTIVCIFLAIKVDSLQKQVDYLYEAKFGNGVFSADNSLSRYEVSGSEGTLRDTDARSSGSNGKRKVYLTFDDGPSENTEAILEVLAKYNVKATFFVVGKEDEGLKPLYKKIVDSGNSIGLHSYSHKYSVLYKSLEDFEADFHKIQDYVKSITGVKTVLYRFPGGSSNQVSDVDMKDLIRFLKEEGVVYFDWNDATGDASTTKYTVTQLVNNAISGLNKEGDTILLMHDANTKGTTVEALPLIIEKLKAMDVEIVPIDMSTQPIQHISADSVE
ncbi:MAG: polysaccharide deacetylase [Lachnospiraceae bacterium]|nr:polysaccharide deacetylase [Lachnospiraceae bacterium]